MVLRARRRSRRTSRSSNLALDLIGQTRALYTAPAKSKAERATRTRSPIADAEREFRNPLLVEQPNGDFADTMARHLIYSAFAHAVL